MLCHMFCFFLSCSFLISGGKHINRGGSMIVLSFVLLFLWRGRETISLLTVNVCSFLNQWGTYFLYWGRKYVDRSRIFFFEIYSFYSNDWNLSLRVFFFESFSWLSFFSDWGRFIIFLDGKLGTFQKCIPQFPWTPAGLVRAFEVLAMGGRCVVATFKWKEAEKIRRKNAVIHLNRKCYTLEN